MAKETINTMKGQLTEQEKIFADSSYPVILAVFGEKKNPPFVYS